MLGKLLGTLASWSGAAVCGYGAWKIIEIILNGVSSGNWLMVIAGGIIGYLFGALLIVGAVVLAIIGFAILAD